MNWESMFPLVNPFVPNPELQQPENNFIEGAISNGIEKGIGNVGEKVIHAGQMKLEGFMQNVPSIIEIGVICFLIYIAWKTLFTGNTKDLSKAVPCLFIYTLFKLVWNTCVLR